MLWVLKRTISMRRFFWAPKTYAQNYGLENIYNLRWKICLSKPPVLPTVFFFAYIFVICNFFFKINFFEKFFQEYHQSVKQFRTWSGPTLYRARSGSKLFAKVISRGQKLPLAGKELNELQMRIGTYNTTWIFFVFSGAKIRPQFQWNLGDFFLKIGNIIQPPHHTSNLLALHFVSPSISWWQMKTMCNSLYMYDFL